MFALLNVHVRNCPDSMQLVRVLWHPHLPDCLAIAAGLMAIAHVRPSSSSAGQPADSGSVEDEAAPQLLDLSQEDDMPWTAVSFSLDATMLAGGNQRGQVCMHDLSHGAASTPTLIPFPHYT